MEALGADKFGQHNEVLCHQTIDELPTCSSTDVLIRVAYSELNPVDLQKLKGGPKQAGQAVPNPPFIPGFGGSGIVLDVGSDVPPPKQQQSLKGKQVAFLADPSRPGSYATHILVDYRLVAELPSSGKVTLQEAASVPLAGCTAYESLVKLGLGKDVIPSEDTKLLVVGAAGGVGSWAITLARAWHPKLTIIATASSPESQNWCQSRGADQVIFHNEIAERLGGGREGSVSHILCLTEPTPPIFGALADVIQPYGTICLVVAGASIQSLDLGFCFFKAANVVTETVFSSIRTKYRQFVPSLEIAEILELLSSGIIEPPLSPQLTGISENWKDALKKGGLLDILSGGHTRGKLNMKVGSDTS